MSYIVSDFSFWAELRFHREMPCGRVRFCRIRQTPPKSARIYQTKAEAICDGLETHQQVIRETKYADWCYELLLQHTVENLNTHVETPKSDPHAKKSGNCPKTNGQNEL